MDPTPETIALTYRVNPVPRKMPVPEGPPGPPAINVAGVAAPVLQQLQELTNPVAANIASLVRGAIAGTPDALRALAEAAPPASTVFQVASAGLGVASLATGVSGAAATLLAGPAAGLPYGIGTAVPAWAALAPVVGGALGAGSAAFQALATGTNAFPALSQWGQLAPQIPAMAIPPPPTAI